MLHVATLLLVRQEAEHQFLKRLRGDWHMLARQLAPELIGTDLLRHQQDASVTLYLCLDFWVNAEAYRHASQSTGVKALLAARRVLAESCLELGEFAFPTLSDFGPATRVPIHECTHES
jgi:hypothetical protein